MIRSRLGMAWPIRAAQATPPAMPPSTTMATSGCRIHAKATPATINPHASPSSPPVSVSRPSFGTRLRHVRHLLRIEVHVHQPDQPALLVHHRKCQQLVERKELTGVEDGSILRDGDDLLHHDFRERPIPWAHEKAARRDHALEPAFAVGD